MDGDCGRTLKDGTDHPGPRIIGSEGDCTCLRGGASWAHYGIDRELIRRPIDPVLHALAGLEWKSGNRCRREGSCNGVLPSLGSRFLQRRDEPGQIRVGVRVICQGRSVVIPHEERSR